MPALLDLSSVCFQSDYRYFLLLLHLTVSFFLDLPPEYVFQNIIITYNKEVRLLFWTVCLQG